MPVIDWTRREHGRQDTVNDFVSREKSVLPLCCYGKEPIPPLLVRTVQRSGIHDVDKPSSQKSVDVLRGDGDESSPAAASIHTQRGVTVVLHTRHFVVCLCRELLCGRDT
jgi:hypothetical protein